MQDFLRKALLFGIGVTAMTREKVEEFAKKTATENNLTEEEGRNLVKELLKKSEEAKRNLEKQVGKLAKDKLEELEVPSREEFQQLEARLQHLESLANINVITIEPKK
ncbi:MAG: hypothetical protein LRZ99_06730 [Desulfotomaculum sp.]|nr:hypothetical protein [Desulfotomaculum sp.]